jgi:D-lactate dehydrogenase
VPRHLPPRLADFGERYEHHLLLKVGGAAIAYTRDLLTACCAEPRGAWFECDPAEAEAAFLHRFVVAGAGKRYCELHAGGAGELLALDIALPRNTRDWFERLPEELDARMALKLYYGHFICHVFHQDYVLRPGIDPQDVKQQLLALLDARGAEYPAEHNVGHLYAAKPPLRDFYRSLDPCNQFNPGIGQTSKQRHWK